MYSRQIVEQNIAKARSMGVVMEPFDIGTSQGRSAKIQEKYLKAVEAGKHAEFTPADRKFMDSEKALCRWDFRYWAERYGFCEVDAADGGGHAVVPFWPSQERALELISKREEECYAEFEKHGITTGILGVWNKTRQQGATALLRLITGHRICTRKYVRAIAASLDDDKLDEIYKRDHIWLDNQPWFLKPLAGFEEKSQHITFSVLKSEIRYEMASQKAGIAVGKQIDVGHFTELSKWPGDDPYSIGAWRLQYDFMPTVPKAISTFLGFESTPWGRGPRNFWHVFTEAIRQKKRGYEQWIYVFTPHYINAHRNRLPAPDAWTPEPMTIEHAELVEKTSPEWTGGRTVRLTREQMYWWESLYRQHEQQDQLHVFLTDYPATPEQGFQHSERSAFSVKTIDWLRNTTGRGVPYHVETTGRGEDHEPIQIDNQVAPALWRVGNAGKVIRMAPAELDDDPRGILWIYELPKRSAQYFMGIDPTVGKTGWNRYARAEADGRTDNGAIVILRKGNGLANKCGCPGCRRLVAEDKVADMPDHVVAEYAAPIDCEEIGEVANVVGRIFAGVEEDQCKTIMETHPGPGKMTMKRMYELGYTNQWMWEYGAEVMNAQSRSPGWHSWRQSNRDLWVKCSRHINLKRLVNFSPSVADECADALFDSVKEYAENLYGHDDRMRALFLAVWAANSWQIGGERTAEPISTGPEVDPQRSAMTVEEVADMYQRRFDAFERLYEG